MDLKKVQFDANDNLAELREDRVRLSSHKPCLKAKSALLNLQNKK